MKSLKAAFSVGTIILASLGTAWWPGAATADDTEQSVVLAQPGFTSFIGDRWSGYISDDSDDTAISPASYEMSSADEFPTEIGYVGDYDDYSTADQMVFNTWVSVEAMHAYARGRNLPPLVTTGSTPANAILPNADVLFGGETVGTNLQGAGRVSFGTWLGCDNRLGIGASFFALEGKSDGYIGTSDATGSPVRARPFFDSADGRMQQAIFTVAAPNLFDGVVEAEADNDVLAGEVAARFQISANSRSRFDVIGGYQFARIDDSLTINSQQVALAGSGFPFPQGTELAFQDIFDVKNQFHGGKVGIIGDYCFGRFSLSMAGKVSFGNMRRTVTIQGQSSVTDIAGDTSNFNGGLLALGSNLGTLVDDRFSVMPEADFKLLYHLTDHIDFSLGYTFMFWSAVAIAGDQIDISRENTPTVNSSQIFDGTLQGPDNPRLPHIDDTDFWVQGISFGVVFHH